MAPTWVNPLTLPGEDIHLSILQGLLNYFKTYTVFNIDMATYKNKTSIWQSGKNDIEC